MQVVEYYRGFRIEAEAEPVGTSVTLKLFALGQDGSDDPDTEPMNIQSFESATEGEAGTAALMQGAVAHARASIDALLGSGKEDPEGDERPRHEIVDDAKDGKPGRLTVPFVAAEHQDRLQEMIRVLDSTPLEGLRAKILLSPNDFEGQPVPPERPDLLGVEASDEVPTGEFHLLLRPYLGPGQILRRDQAGS